MTSDMQRLSRLIKIHSKLVQDQANVVVQYANSIASCEVRMKGVLSSMELYQAINLPNGPMFSQKIREIKEMKERLEKEIDLAKFEQKRLSSVVDELNERRNNMIYTQDDEEKVEIAESWLQMEAIES